MPSLSLVEIELGPVFLLLSLAFSQESGPPEGCDPSIEHVMLLVDLIIVQLVVAQRFIVSMDWGRIEAHVTQSPVLAMSASLSPRTTAEICVNAGAPVVVDHLVQLR